MSPSATRRLLVGMLLAFPTIATAWLLLGGAWTFAAAATIGVLAAFVVPGAAGGLGVAMGTWLVFEVDYQRTLAAIGHGSWEAMASLGLLVFGLYAAVAAISYAIARAAIGRRGRPTEIAP